MRVRVRDIIFNNISVISWRSVLLVEETGVLGENHRPISPLLIKNTMPTKGPTLMGQDFGFTKTKMSPSRDSPYF
jgi:hypothetical protein